VIPPFIYLNKNYDLQLIDREALFFDSVVGTTQLIMQYNVQNFWMGSTATAVNLTAQRFINTIINHNVTHHQPFAIITLVFGITTAMLLMGIIAYTFKTCKQQGLEEQQRLIQHY